MGVYIRLTDFKNAQEKEKEFFNPENKYTAKQKDFEKIPGSPIAYWVSDRELALYSKGKLFKDKVSCKKGIDTGKNELFLRLWHEISTEHFPKSFSKEDLSKYNWFSYNKGGEYRKWYGNREYLINWVENGENLKSRLNLKTSKPTLRNLNYMFKEGFTWSTVSSSDFSSRYTPKGSLFDNGGCTFFSNKNLLTRGAFSNSKIANRYFEFLAPTLNFQPGNVDKLLFLEDESQNFNIETITQKCINLAKDEWDSRETSWDFTKNQLIMENGELRIEKAVDQYENYWMEQFVQMHRNEEELNRLFIEIYGLEGEMDPYVDFEDITLLKKEKKIIPIEIPASTEKEQAEKDKTTEGYLYNRGALLKFDRNEIIKQFISYSVGCIMGRYSLDKPGLIMANSDDQLRIENGKLRIEGLDGEVRHEIDKPIFIPDSDGIVPILDDDSSEIDDDITNRFMEFVRAAYGDDSLDENLLFIAESIGKKKTETSKECIRRYFLNEFTKDHMQRYKKRPIYWLFTSSNKGKAFNALVYLHRYNENTVGKMRQDYLLKYQAILEAKLKIKSEEFDSLEGAAKKKAEKEKKSLAEKVNEIKEYDEKVKYYAEHRISLDLDDGVKVNYKKLGDILYQEKSLLK